VKPHSASTKCLTMSLLLRCGNVLGTCPVFVLFENMTNDSPASDALVQSDVDKLYAPSSPVFFTNGKHTMSGFFARKSSGERKIYPFTGQTNSSCLNKEANEQYLQPNLLTMGLSEIGDLAVCHLQFIVEEVCHISVRYYKKYHSNKCTELRNSCSKCTLHVRRAQEKQKEK